ncbi:MAG: glycoside hydrolase family 27 protein [Mangrovibacterium sp.]
MNKLTKLAVTVALLFAAGATNAQEVKPPVMGWSSWNNYHVDISEDIIKAQADAMVESGMAAVGYQFINIDDGFFGGRDSLTGRLYCHPVRFPSGMRMVSDYIRSKGLTPGIYSEGGENTCGSKYDNDPHGIGVGFYGHEVDDAKTYFVDWNFDFIKIDWCGGKVQQLDEEDQYSYIIETIRKVKSEARINICRWEYPGKWVEKLADSWRISPDIRSNFGSVRKIIDIAADTYMYSSAGHYNDLDMLQVGRGMTYDEDVTHFTMWCFMNSPLLAGNDMTNMSDETVSILTNKEVIALNQDKGFYQGRRMKVDEKTGVEIWEKKLGENHEGLAIVLYNPEGKDATYTLTSKEIGVDKTAKFRDLWKHEDMGEWGKKQEFSIPKHGVVCVRMY